MDIYTFGKNKADVCLVEELIVSNNKKELKTVSKTLLTLSNYLNLLEKCGENKALQSLTGLIKKEFIRRVMENNQISSPKVRSYLINSINGKVNDFDRFVLKRDSMTNRI